MNIKSFVPEFVKIDHNGPLYWQLVALRDELLRKPLKLSFTEKQLAEERDQFHFGAFWVNEAIATFILLETDPETLKMRQVAVSDQWQGEGIGRSLNQFAEKWARENNYKKIFCHARDTAVPFYLKCGYKIIGEQFEEVGIPHYMMKKDLM